MLYPKSNADQFFWPLVILLLGLAMTGSAWRYAYATSEEKSLAEFNLHARDAAREVLNRIEVYFGVLRSAGAFFAGSNSVTRAEWNTYVDFIKPKESYPGIEGMGVIRRITNGQKGKFENAAGHENSQSHTGYIIHPPGVRESYFPVIYFWPPLPHIDLLGLDHGAYPAGFKALEMARDSGMVTISRSLPYAKGSDDRNSPILFIFPIYRNGMPITTIDERQQAIWGYVYTRINTDELFRDAISSSVTEEIYLEIFEGGNPSQETPSLDKANIIYDADLSAIPHALDASFIPHHHITQQVGVDGTTWLFYTASRPDEVTQRDVIPLLILLIGSLLSMGASYFFSVRDRQKRLTQHHAYHDSLTNLPNRMLLQDRFQQALANAQRHGTKLAMLFLDLDNFKPINDCLGHAAGDKVLKAVAACLASCLREGDTLSRLGGDEFVILLLNITREEEASAVAQKIIDTISRLAPIAGKEIHLGSSAGISIFPKDGTSFEDLLKNADVAMYRAKEAGRNNFQFCA